jgi:predicted amidohydrolase
MTMVKINYAFLSLLLGFAGLMHNCNNGSPVTRYEPELTSNFEPLEWAFETNRDELAPLHFIDSTIIFRQKPTLALSGKGKGHVNGLWSKTIDIVPGEYYHINAFFKADNTGQPWRCILARIIWLDENNRQTGFTEYPPTLSGLSPAGWNQIGKVYQAPSLAGKARIELVYRWNAEGTVHFGDVSFNLVNKPEPRPVRLATVYHRPRNSSGSNENLEQFAQLVAEAGASRADIVCLPEGLTMVGTSHTYLSASETIPGPSTEFLGKVARKHNLYIVAGILEQESDVIYNTAVLIDREGTLAGKYRKVALPREEIDGGITPGENLPVFDTDFGRIGIMICWDVTFPEVARTLALKGAEIILMPIWGGNLTLTRARSIENQVYLVTSTYDMVSGVFDLEGEILDQATTENPVVVTEVDLGRQFLWPWLGDLKNRIPREIPSSNSTVWQD